jgi:maltooligosyltrehalose trehalohydrolase
MTSPAYPWERPLGATPVDDALVEFRVWAPRAGGNAVAVRLHGQDHPLVHEDFGICSARLPARHGDDYAFVLDPDGEAGGVVLPDPSSRWQPEGLRGPSRVLDPRRFAWSAPRPAVAPADLVLYELHVGTFTPAGTFDAAIEHLPALAQLGVTAIEVMPVAEFPGRRGWGYDGVYLSAAQSSYGGPEAFQRLVDAAHAAGLAVVLDVVYNHVGASGVAALEAFGPYFTEKHETFWGKAINYDDADCDPVRSWVLQSAEGWIRDFRVDGLRLDAIHAIHDESAHPILAVLADRVHGVDHRALVISESGQNDPRVIRPPGEGGWGHDAVWADDFHHALRVLVTGEAEGYYEEFGAVADLAKALRRPFVHDGQYSTFRRRRFGAPAPDRPVEQFVVFDQNHDQVGNRALGDRLPRAAQPLAAFCTLLSPFTPMLFMGEEYGERAPFRFFTDHIDEEIAVATREGRRREFAAFAAFAGEEVPDPQDPQTFESSKLTREEDPAIAALYRRLLALRRELPARDVDDVRFGDDEDGRWLRVRRGPFEMACNFGGLPARVEVEGRELVLATGGGVRLRDGHAELPPLSGALVR